MRILRRSLAVAVLLIPGALQQAYGQTFAASGTTTLSVGVAPEAALNIGTATTTLTTGSTAFGSSYGGTTNFTYKIRTSAATSTLTLQITTDFSTGTGGKPSVASPPTAGDKLQYTCSVTSPGTGCGAATTASTTAATSVATFAATSSSASAGNTGSVSWTLTDDPVYPVGTYTAVATFTISAS